MTVSYTSSVLSRLASIEIDVLPQQLNDLAGKARGHIVDLGKQGTGYPANLASLAEDTRAYIVGFGGAFHPEVIQSIGDQVKAQLLADGAQGLDLYSLAEKARGHIVDLGAKLSGWGLRSGNGNELAKILQIGDTPDVQTVDDSPSYLFQFRVASNLPLPRVGPGMVKLFCSQSGENMIVSWAQSDRVLYRNGQRNGAGVIRRPCSSRATWISTRPIRSSVSGSATTDPRRDGSIGTPCAGRPVRAPHSPSG